MVQHRTFDDMVDEIYYRVQHLEPWEKVRRPNRYPRLIYCFLVWAFRRLKYYKLRILFKSVSNTNTIYYTYEFLHCFKADSLIFGPESELFLIFCLGHFIPKHSETLNFHPLTGIKSTMTLVVSQPPPLFRFHEQWERDQSQKVGEWQKMIKVWSGV